MSNDDDNSEEDDLYGDVMGVKPAAKTALPSTFSSRQPADNAPPLSLTDQVQMLQKRVSELEQENENLQRNIGTLYRTAKAELERKEDQIQQLMNEKVNQ